MEEANTRLLSAAAAYRLMMKWYTLLPYHLAPTGHALPAWHYFFEVTRRCNLRCQMCQYLGWLKNTPVSAQKEGELSAEEWLGVIDQVRRFNIVTFTGGEPFLREDFPRLLERACERTHAHVITNAVLLTEERVRQCVDLAPKKFGGIGLNFLGTSVEGPAEVHDSIRSMRGAFEKTTGAIKRIAELRKQAGKKHPMVHMTTVIQERNVEHLARMPEIAAEAGADVLNFTLEIRLFELAGVGETAPDTYNKDQIVFPKIAPDRLAAALRDTRIAAAKAGIELRMPDMPDAEIVRYYQGETDLRAFRCGGIWNTLFVSAKGDVYPCWIRKVGNVRERGLKELWNGPEFRAFRRQIREGLPAPCVGCCMISYKG